MARYGGEEFGVILPEVDSAMMPGVMRAMMTSVSSDSVNGIGGSEISTVSIGAVSVIPRRDQTPTDALAAADRLLYEAKGGGRDRAVHLDLMTLTKDCIGRDAASGNQARPV